MEIPASRLCFPAASSGLVRVGLCVGKHRRQQNQGSLNSFMGSSHDITHYVHHILISMTQHPVLTASS